MPERSDSFESHPLLQTQAHSDGIDIGQPNIMGVPQALAAVAWATVSRSGTLASPACEAATTEAAGSASAAPAASDAPAAPMHGGAAPSRGSKRKGAPKSKGKRRKQHTVGGGGGGGGGGGPKRFSFK